MEDIKYTNSSTNEEYLRIIPQMSKYFKNVHIRSLFEWKCALFATGGRDKKVDIFSNSLEYMGSFQGHCLGIIKNRILLSSLSCIIELLKISQDCIKCLETVSDRLISSGSDDKTVKIWDLEMKVMRSNLEFHKLWVTALCLFKPGILISGSGDLSLIIWDLEGEKAPQVLSGHLSTIFGILSLSHEQIISGEHKGNLRIWNIEECSCLIHIHHKPKIKEGLWQIKMFEEGNVACCMDYTVSIWGVENAWRAPRTTFKSVRFLDSLKSIGSFN